MSFKNNFQNTPQHKSIYLWLWLHFSTWRNTSTKNCLQNIIITSLLLYQANLAFQFLVTKLWVRIPKNISTWSYENRVSKHFVIFLNFPCLIACLLCCLLMPFFFFACFVVRDLCRSGIRQNYFLTLPPSPYFFPHPRFFLLTQVTVIWNQRRLRLRCRLAQLNFIY